MKNLTKSLSYFFFFLMLGFVACKSSNNVEPANAIIGKWKMTVWTMSPMPSSITQKDLDGYVDCFKNIVNEFTATKATVTGKDCFGNSYNEQYDYTASGGKLTDKSTGETTDFSINGNTFTTSSYDPTDKTTTKVTYTRL